MAHLFVELLKDSLNEYAYAAEIAGVHYKLENTMYGIFVSTAHIFKSVVPDSWQDEQNIFLYFFTELKIYHLSYSVYKTWRYRHNWS